MANIKEQVLIDSINNIKVGECSRIQAKLQQVEMNLKEINQVDLSVLVHDAQQKLEGGDVPGFRKLLAQVVSRLGHLK
ncbi:hypothetical protein ACFLU6_10160 [Acidobacteriota bacterium]